MRPTNKLSMTCLIAFAVLLALLGGCATRMPLDVGQVVVAPQPVLPPPPAIVRLTLPHPAGYYQSQLLIFFSPSPETQTKPAQPMQAAGQTPSQ